MFPGRVVDHRPRETLRVSLHLGEGGVEPRWAYQTTISEVILGTHNGSHVSGRQASVIQHEALSGWKRKNSEIDLVATWLEIWMEPDPERKGLGPDIGSDGGNDQAVAPQPVLDAQQQVERVSGGRVQLAGESDHVLSVRLQPPREPSDQSVDRISPAWFVERRASPHSVEFIAPVTEAIRPWGQHLSSRPMGPFGLIESGQQFPAFERVGAQSR